MRDPILSPRMMSTCSTLKVCLPSSHLIWTTQPLSFNEILYVTRSIAAANTLLIAVHNLSTFFLLSTPDLNPVQSSNCVRRFAITREYTRERLGEKCWRWQRLSEWRREFRSCVVQVRHNFISIEQVDIILSERTGSRMIKNLEGRVFGLSHLFV